MVKKTESQLFKNIKKMDKSLVKLSQKNREDIKSNNKSEKEYIITGYSKYFNITRKHSPVNLNLRLDNFLAIII